MTRYLLATTAAVLLLSTTAFAEEVLATGTFEDSRQHDGQGTATIVKLDDGRTVVRLSEDFRTDRGPDLKVWLVEDQVITASDVTDDNYISLGGLRRARGAGEYEIPADVDINNYQEVVIWCRAFRVLFTSAELST
ncbi:MAG: DM13 domain-containing protein [Pseudomonadota bacterium]